MLINRHRGDIGAGHGRRGAAGALDTTYRALPDEMYAENERDRRSVSVVSAGQGAEHSRYAGPEL